MNVEDSSKAGDRIFINRYQLGEVNDIVVAQVSWFDNYIIKRMIGTPGDKIEIKDHTTHYSLYVNDKILYSKEKTGESGLFASGSIGYFQTYQDFLTSDNFKEYVETDEKSTYIKLEDDEYFLMGDNWGHTLDCLTNGPISASEIVGKVELIIDVSTRPQCSLHHL